MVVRLVDDGSGLGSSTSEGAAGIIQVFAASETVPAPALPEPGEIDAIDTAETVSIVVINDVESTIQVNFATGSGTAVLSGEVP